MVKQKKIIIDARMYGLEHAGIGRYVVNLVREIKCAKDTSEVANFREKSQDSVAGYTESMGSSSIPQSTVSASSEVEGKGKTLEFYLLIRKSKLNEIKREMGNSFKLVIAEASHYSLKEQIILPVLLFKLRPDLVHFPHFNVPLFWWGKQVATIHDLIKHESRGMETTTRWKPFYWFKYFVHEFVIWSAVRRATRVIVPSGWWRDELIRRYNLPVDKIAVIYEGVDKKFKVQSQKFRVKSKARSLKLLNKYGIKKPFILYVGNLYPHKNIERLVQAVKLINGHHSNYHTTVCGNSWRLVLVVVCTRNVFYERFRKKIKQMKAEKFVNLVGFVPDEDLAILYRQAKAFIFPSLLEGFGLPGLEAMACGCPVVASNSSCLPESYGQAALYFDPLDVSDMAEKIKQVVGDRQLRDQLIKRGFEQVKKYSWQKMAIETLGVYKSVLKND